MAEGPNTLWTDIELADAAEGYLFMLRIEQSGLRRWKEAAGVLLLTEVLDGRSDASIRYRMRNISAVMQELGAPVLAAYSPAEQVGTNVRDRLKVLLSQHPSFADVMRIRSPQERSSLGADDNLRTEALERLAALRSHLDDLEREILGVGHNNPPQPLTPGGPGRQDFEQARSDIRTLEAEVKNAVPDLVVAASRADRLMAFGLKVALWMGRRATKFTDAALIVLAPVAVAKVTGLVPLLVEALSAVARAMPH